MRLPGDAARCRAQSVAAITGVASDREDTRRATAAWNQGSHASAMETAGWAELASSRVVVADAVVVESAGTGETAGTAETEGTPGSPVAATKSAGLEDLEGLEGGDMCFMGSFDFARFDAGAL